MRPRLADYVVDVLAPVATGLIVGHEPSSLHLLVAAQIAGAFLGLRPRVATVVGIVGAGGLAIGILEANLDRPHRVTSEGYQIAETGAIWMGLTLGIIVFANLARHMWWQRRRLAETTERERTNAMLKQRFIAMVSHEFRTPLTGIRGYADLLANTRDGLSADEIGDFAATIRDQAEHLSRLVDDVLVVMRLDAGRLPLTIAAVELWPVIATLEAGILASSGRSLTIGIPPHTRVMADSDRLLQVLRNLTENAVKYGRTKVEIRAEDLNTQIRVTVSDDGPGIPEERVGDIFAEFVQLDDSGSKGSDSVWRSSPGWSTRWMAPSHMSPAPWAEHRSS